MIGSSESSLVRFISRRLQAFRKRHASSVEEQDAAMLTQLVQVGADLSRPRHQRHYFNFGTRQAAELAMPKLASEGFEVELADNPETGHWLLVATRTSVVNKDVLNDLRPHLIALGAQVGGRYTGWEAAVKP